MKKIPLENAENLFRITRMSGTKLKKKCAQLFRRTHYLKIRPKILQSNFPFLNLAYWQINAKLRYWYAKHIFGEKRSRDQ